MLSVLLQQLQAYSFPTRSSVLGPLQISKGCPIETPRDSEFEPFAASSALTLTNDRNVCQAMRPWRRTGCIAKIWGWSSPFWSVVDHLCTAALALLITVYVLA